MAEKMRLTRSRLATSSPGSEDIILLDGMRDFGAKRRRNKSGVSVNGEKDMEVEYIGRITRSRRKSRLSDESVSAEIIFVDDMSNCEPNVLSGSDSSPPSRVSARKGRNRSSAELNNKGRDSGSRMDLVRFCDLRNGAGVVVGKSCRETDDSSGGDRADVIVLDQLVPLADGFYDDETVSGSPKRRCLEAVSVQSKWASSEQVQFISKELLEEPVAEATKMVGKSSQAGSLLLNFEHIISGVRGVESGSSDSNVKILLRSVDSGLCGSQAVKRKTDDDVLFRNSPVQNGDSAKSEANACREENAKNSSNLSEDSVSVRIASISSSSAPQASCSVAGNDMMCDGSVPSSSEEFTAVDPSHQTCGDFNEGCVEATFCRSGAPTVIEPASSFEVRSSVSKNINGAESNSHELVPTQPHEQVASEEISDAVESSVMTPVADYDNVLEDQANIVPVPIEHTLVSAEIQRDSMDNSVAVVVESPTMTERNVAEEEMTDEQQVTSMVISVDPSATEVNDSEIELTLGASVEVSDEIEENVVAPKMIIDEEWIQAMECSRIEVKPVGLVRRSLAHELIVEPQNTSICPDQHITRVKGHSENNTESMISSDVPLVVDVNTNLVLQRPSAASESAPAGNRTSSDDDGTVTAVVVGTSKICRRIYDRTVHKEFSCPRCQKSYMLLHPFKVHLLKCCPHNLPMDLPLTRQELRTKQLMFSPENIAKAVKGIPAKTSSDPTKSRSCPKSPDIVTVPNKRLKMIEKSPTKSQLYHSTDSNVSSCPNDAASMPRSNFVGSNAVLLTTNSVIAGPVASTNKQKGIDENSTTSSTESELQETSEHVPVPNGNLNSSKSGSNCEADHDDKQIMSPPTAKPCLSERQAKIKLFSIYMGQRPKPGPVEFPSEYPDETPEENLAYVLFTVEMEPGGMFYKDRRQMAMKLLNATAKKPSSNPSIKPPQHSSAMPPPPPPSLPTSQWRLNVAHTIPRPFVRAGLSRSKPYYESRGFKPMLQRSEKKAQLENSRLGSENETALAQVGRCKPLFESGRHLRGSYAPFIPLRLP